jgi:hypothetical protein
LSADYEYEKKKIIGNIVRIKDFGPGRKNTIIIMDNYVINNYIWNYAHKIERRQKVDSCVPFSILNK